MNLSFSFFNKKYLGALIAFVSLDQITKQLAVFFLIDGPTYFTEWFRLYLTYNQGVAFSIPFPRWGLVFLTMIFVLFFAFSFWESLISRWQQYGGVLILAGAIGNLIDRVLFGQVIDFLSFWTFPVFNVADICISVGVFILLLVEFAPKSEYLDFLRQD